MKKADVWSLGVTLFIFTYNRFPYEFRSNSDGKSMTEIDIMESIANCELNFPQGVRNVSDGLKQLLSMMLEKDPSKRPDIQVIKSHSEFLNNHLYTNQPYYSPDSMRELDRKMSDIVMIDSK